MSMICESNNAHCVIIFGDVNTDFNGISPQTNELEQSCISKGFKPCLQCDCNEVEYTFVSKSNDARSLIDHMLISDNLKDIVEVCKTEDGIDNESYHIPVICSFNCKCTCLTEMQSQHYPRVAWYKATLVDIEQYKQCLDKELDQMYIFNDALNIGILGAKYTVI